MLDCNNEAHSEIHKGRHISIQWDHDPQNPRTDYDHAATMVCFHGRYNLGDEHSYANPFDAVADVCSLDDDDLRERFEKFSDALAEAPIRSLPLYLYDHSGITMNTTGFHCPWDSGQVGFIYVTNETADKEWPLQDGETEEDRDKRIYDYLRGEVSEYDSFLTGNIYGYVISEYDPETEETGDELESCWGFIGDYDAENGILSEARSLVDGLANEKE